MLDAASRRALTERDLRAALELTLEAQAASSIEELRGALLPGLRRLIACDHVGYNEVDLERRTVLGIVDPDDYGLHDIDQRLLAVAGQHPLIGCQRGGDLSARALSDFLSARRLHRLELYHELYRLIEVEDQLVFGLGGEVLVAFVLARSRRGFSERDRELLELLRPHLTLAYRHVRERERARVLVQALDGELRRRDIGVVTLDPRGRIAGATGAAADLLDVYLACAAREGDALPGLLRSAAGDQRRDRGARELRIDGARGQLRIREQPSAGPWRALVLEERRVTPPGIDALRSLGLTERQAQVTRLLACGKRTRQIAAELRISPATVEKHLEHVYDRLGVSTRAEAVARVYA